MRGALLIAVPSLLLAFATPAEAQISATINIGPQTFGRGGVVVRRPAPPPPVVVVADYHRLRMGDWRRHIRDWCPVTLYVAGGRYYDRPWGSARKVVVYRYRNQYFHAPRDRDFDRYRQRYERNEWRDDRRELRRDDRRDDRRADNRSRPRQG